jgi:hypothetical protein
MDLARLPSDPKTNTERNPSKGVPFFDVLPVDIQQRLQQEEEFGYFFGFILTQFFARQRQYAYHHRL